MDKVARHVVKYAQQLAREVNARALVFYADAIKDDDELRRLVKAAEFPSLLVTRAKEPRVDLGAGPHRWVTIPEVPLTRASQFRSTMLVCLARKALRHGDRVVFLGGADGSGVIDSAFVVDVGSVPELFSLEDAAS
ncbi:MAG TPA: hypothetical protein VFW33_13175, partial [Gemmataceae bacterium]|nr:hypothetical protein [Gemmataceae bacterium]